MTTLLTLFMAVLLQLAPSPAAHSVYLPLVQAQTPTVGLSDITLASSTADNLLSVGGLVRNQTTHILLNLVLMIDFYDNETLVQSSSVVLAGWVVPGEQVRFNVTVEKPEVWDYILFNLRWRLENGQ